MADIKRRRIDQVRDADFLTNLHGLSVDELRSRRMMCDDLDIELSYYRRMLHGRMDLVSFEMRKRAGEEEQSLLDALPRILSEGAYSPSPGLPTRSVPIEVPDIPTPGRRIIDRALQGDFLARLPALEVEELEATHVFLTEMEREVSQQRRLVHDALDRLQEELARRYREGQADPGELLTSE